MRKLRHEEVERHYLLGDIKLLSEYVNTRTKNKLKCLKERCNNEWSARYCSYKQRNNGCPRCSRREKITHEKAKKNLKEKGYDLIGEFRGSMAKVEVKCGECGYRRKAVYNNIVRGKAKCPACSEKRRLTYTTRELAEVLLSKEVLLVEEFKGSVNKKHKLKCNKCKKNWITRPASIISLGSGCPCCARTGFNPDQPGILYVMKLDIVEGIYYKIGICGAERLEARRKEIHPSIEVIGSKYFELGRDAQKEEARLHKKFSKYRVNLGGIVNNGHTEFFTKYE